MLASMQASQTTDHLLLLRNIRDTAIRIQSRCPSSQAPTARRSPQPEALQTWDFDANLLCSKPITSELEALGVDSDTALEFSAAYTSAASRLKRLCEALLRKGYSVSDPSSTQDQSKNLLRLNSAFSKKCQLGLQQWKEATLRVSRSASRNTCISSQSNNTRQAFNQDSVALLEKYFEYNNYPIAADRAMLSQKTGLTLRQVEVWFQNHRNRAKRAGKPMKRLRHDESPGEFSLDGLEEKVPSLKRRSCKRPPEACPTTLTLGPQAAERKQPTPALHPTRPRETVLDIVHPPPYAFPASSQPLERSDVLSLQQFQCSQLEWFRHPAKKLTRRRTAPTIDDLCESLRFLNLRERSKRSHTEAFVEDETSTASWSPATYITLPPTRHPALVEMRRDSLQMPQFQQPGDSSPLCLFQPCFEPRRYSPHRLDATGFLKYQHQTAKLNKLPLTPQTAPLYQLRRRSSASSVDSSVGCSTPISSPMADAHLLLNDSETFQDTLSSDTLLRDQDILPLSNKLLDSNSYTFCLTPPLLHSI